MSTRCGWEGDGRYGSFRSRMNVCVCVCAGKTVRSLENTCHTWALLRWGSLRKGAILKYMHLYLYAPLPLCTYDLMKIGRRGQSMFWLLNDTFFHSKLLLDNVCMFHIIKDKRLVKNGW